jgi:hypothetical protein
MTRWETDRYTQLLPDGKARQFQLRMETNSVITSPSGMMEIKPGCNRITGLAWSGHGAPMLPRTRKRQGCGANFRNGRDEALRILRTAYGARTAFQISGAVLPLIRAASMTALSAVQ